MPSNEALRRYLRENRIDYAVTSHPVAYTAQEVAHAVRVSGYELAKVVVLQGGGGHLMAVLPAPLMVDLEALREHTGIRDLHLETEDTFAMLFPDSEKGAMHPFGGLYGLSVWLDASLAGRDEIVFNACTHRETITMSCRDYERLAAPKVARFAVTKDGKHPDAHAPGRH